VKCDEGQPSCEKCSSTGRICDGYEVTIHSSPKTPHSTGSTRYLARSPSIDIFNNEKARRSFHFFLSRTAPQLSAFYGDPFWNHLVLQATHHEPAIRHAIVALGSLHERFEKHDGNIRSHEDCFPIQEYSRAIQALVAPFARNEPQAMDVCLISCILFTCFEVRKKLEKG
jgi:hypothetical protein